MNRRIRCIVLSTSFGECSGIGWALFTHHDGLDSPKDALRSLATELVARYRERARSRDNLIPGRVDVTRFVAFLNHLLRGQWGDYGNPDSADGMQTRWWPFTSFADVLQMPREEVVVVPGLASEVLLASYDSSLLGVSDLNDISENLEEIAAILGLARGGLTVHAVGQA